MRETHKCSICGVIGTWDEVNTHAQEHGIRYEKAAKSGVIQGQAAHAVPILNEEG